MKKQYGFSFCSQQVNPEIIVYYIKIDYGFRHRIIHIGQWLNKLKKFHFGEC